MKKGFTLVELLAVLIILGVIIAIIVPVTNSLINNSKQSAYDQQITTLIDQALRYSTENKLGYENNKYKTISFEQLMDSGLISELPNNPLTEGNLEGCIIYTWKEERQQYEFLYDDNCDPSDENELYGIKVDLITTKQAVNGWYNSDLEVLVDTNADSYKYCVDTTTCNPDLESGSIDITTNDIHTVCAIGYRGNETSDVVCKQFKLDKMLPVITPITEHAELPENTEMFSKELFTYTIGISGGIVTCDPVNTNNLSGGRHNITCTATSTSGLKTSATKEVNILHKNVTIAFETSKNPINGWYNDDLSVTVKTNSDDYIYCISSGECEPTIENSPINLIENGNYTVCAIASNSIYSSEKLCQEFKIDKLKPVLTAKDEDYTITTGTNSNSENFFNSAFGPAGGSITCDPANTSFLEAGNQTLTCTATGTNGLTTTATKSIKVVSNTVNLTLSPSKTTSNGWVNSDYVINVNHTGISYKYCIGTDCTPTQTGTININTNGTHTVCAIASNELVSSQKICETYKLDKTKPVLTAKTESYTITNGTSNYSKNYFNNSFGPAGGVVTCTPANTNTLGVGTQTLSCTATGNNGLRTTTTKSIKVVSNTVDLTLSPSKTTSNGWVNSDYVINVNHTGISYKYCVGSNCTPTQTGTININTNGTHTVCAIASNELVSSQKVCGTYKLDKQAPTISAKTSTVPIIEGTSSLVKDYFNYSFGVSSGNVNCNINNTSGLEIGTHQVTCTATGNNAKNSSAIIEFDVLAPTVDLTLTPTKTTANGWVNTDYQINVNHSGTSYRYCFGAGCTPNQEGTFEVDVVDGSKTGKIDINTNGTNTLCVIASNGLVDSQKVCGIYKLDKTTPVLTAKSTPTAIIVGTNTYSKDYFNNSFGPAGGVVTCTPANTNTLGVGTHTLSCTATGNNGLKTTTTKSLKVVSDTVSISLTPTKTAASGWVTSDYQINVNHSGNSYLYCLGANCTPSATGTININTSGTHTVCATASNELVTSQKVCGTYKLDKTAPTATSVSVSNVSTTGFDVYIYGVTENHSGINRIQVPTWTNHNGQDDLATSWQTNTSVKAINLGGGTYKYRVNISSHNNESGTYSVHVYGYDSAGNYGVLGTTSANVPVAFSYRDFAYTGGIQSFTVPVTGVYKLEVWGAQGGGAKKSTTSAYQSIGGYGGYTAGTVRLTQGHVLYIGVGGQGGIGYTATNTNFAGPFNGGGGGSYAIQSSGTWWYGGAGGGASHIALNYNRGELHNYASYPGNVLIVAGGGGGATAVNGWQNDGSGAVGAWNGGNGGGYVGSDGVGVAPYRGTGGTQSSGGGGSYAGTGTFGHGGDIIPYHHTAGGGGGWYGGGGGYGLGGGGGGSSYVGGVSAISVQSGVRGGDGYARITFVSY